MFRERVLSCYCLVAHRDEVDASLKGELAGLLTALLLYKGAGLVQDETKHQGGQVLKNLSTMVYDKAEDAQTAVEQAFSNEVEVVLKDVKSWTRDDGAKGSLVPYVIKNEIGQTAEVVFTTSKSGDTLSVHINPGKGTTDAWKRQLHEATKTLDSYVKKAMPQAKREAEKESK